MTGAVGIRFKEIIFLKGSRGLELSVKIGIITL